MDPEWRLLFPIKNGDIPASYVSLPEGTCYITTSFVYRIVYFIVATGHLESFGPSLIYLRHS